MASEHQFISLAHEQDKVIVFEKGCLLFVFNFHPTKSFTNYKVGTQWDSDHMILLDTDRLEFGGQDRLAPANNQRFLRHKEPFSNRPLHLKLYVPCRCAIVLIAE